MTSLLDDERLTRDEAFQRAELIELDRYTIALDVSNALDLQAQTYPVTTTLTFTARQPGATTFLNYLGASVERVTLNGTDLDLDQHVGSARIVLPELAAHNTVEIQSHSWYSRSGEGLHRFVDPADGQVYLYSQFEPADARRVYPNMEQPDLKARFAVSITGPETWTLASNGHEIGREPLGEGRLRVDFATTQPVSTYLTTFLAGPYAQFRDTWSGHSATGAGPIELRIFARQSLAQHVDTEELFEHTAQGLTWFHDQFQVPYPWGKYDQAFVPEYNLGAMENPGLVTFNEAYIFTSRATVSQRMQRANTLMHEMSHMWFGNYVTMRWWDDLWLKESFADFYGSKAVAEATTLPGAWQSFAHQRKAWAYVQDSYPTTHPIVADIVDLEAARQNFDGITYAKGAAVIKQLYHYVGQDAFLQACRSYFRTFAFSTAQLADFLGMLEHASGRDMRDWSQAWLETAGPATLWTTVDEGTVTLHQASTDPLTEQQVLRPHALYVAEFGLNEHQQLVQVAEHEVLMPAGADSVALPDVQLTADQPRALIVNQHDQTYAQVEFDQATLDAVTTYPTIDADSTAVATVWSTLWTMVRQAKLSAGVFVRAVCQLGNSIDDVSMHARVLDQAVVALQEFAPVSQRKQLTKQLSGALLEALAHLEPGSDRQRSAARAFAHLGIGAPTLAGELTFLLAADETSQLSPGLTVDDEIKWQLLTGLASSGRIDQTRLDEELAGSHTATNELFHRTATAVLADQPVRAALVEAVLAGEQADGRPLSNAQLTATAQGLAAMAPSDDVPGLRALLDQLLTIWSSRSNGLATRTINGLFPLRHSPSKGGAAAQADHPVLALIDTWLAEHPQAPHALRRLVVERRTDIAQRLVAQTIR